MNYLSIDTLQYKLVGLSILFSIILFSSLTVMLPAFATPVTVTVGAGPIGVAVNPTTNKIYVANNGDNTVSVIDGSTNAVTTTILDGAGPIGVAVNPTTNKIYVANSGGGTVSVIDGSTNAVTTSIPVGSGSGSTPYGIAVNPTTNTIYVANNGDGTVSVIDGSTNAVTTTITVGIGPSFITVNPTTNTIYVANNISNTVSVIDGSTNAVTTTITVGNTPYGIAVNPTTNTIYVANNISNTVSVIDGSTNAVTTTITVGLNPYGIAVNPTTNTIYVANNGDNTVSVIDGSTNAVTTTITVGMGPADITVNPTTNIIYVANSGDNTVSVIQNAGSSVATTTSISSSPSSPILSGQSITFTATISPPSATGGTVQFAVDGVNVGSPILISGGQAMYSTSSLTAGIHSITATYSGDPTSNSAGSTSTITMTVLNLSSGKIHGEGKIGKGQNFELNVHSDDGKKFNGNVEYTDKSAKIELDGKSTAMSIYNSQMNAMVIGTAKLDDDHNKNLYNFIIQVTESTTKSVPDTFAITITDNTGKTIYQNSGNVQGHIEINKNTDKNDHNDDDHRQHHHLTIQHSHKI